MSKSCGCGLAVGILIGLLICGAIAAFFYFHNNPEQAQSHIVKVEERWEKVKSGGDDGINFVKNHVRTAPPPPQETVVPAK